jgi:excisionase family DNA binding protein
MLSVVSEIKKQMPITGSSDHPAGAPPETYTVEEAAKVLNRTARHVRRLLNSGALAGERDGGARGTWRVYKLSTHALRDRLRDRTTIAKREPATMSKVREQGASQASSRELFRVVQELQKELGRVEERLEIAEVTESTLREQLEAERENTRMLRAWADSERLHLEALQRELEAERSRGFWRRLLGN